MSEEKARVQAMRFQDIFAVIDLIDAAQEEGLRTSMWTANNRIGLICDHMHANPEKYADFLFFPCMPYAHEYVSAITLGGPISAFKHFIPVEGLLSAAMRGGMSLARMDVARVGTLLIDAEMRMFQGLNPAVISCRTYCRSAIGPAVRGGLAHFR